MAPPFSLITAWSLTCGRTFQRCHLYNASAVVQSWGMIHLSAGDFVSGPWVPRHKGEMARLIGSFDWSRTNVGSLCEWPPYLRSAVDVMLGANVQIVLFWGPQFLALYNDAYAPTIGDKHPHALGKPACEYWAELWADLEPLLRRVLETGETVSAKDRPFYIERGRGPETVYFDISCSPVHGDDGAVAGVSALSTKRPS